MNSSSDRPLREEHADQTRAAVIAAARQLFAENGFFQTKVEEIARLSRVSPATVYAQCGGKQGLLRLLMDSWTQSQVVAESYQESLAAARGVPDVDGVVQVEVLGQGGKVVGVVVHVVALTDLRGAAVPAPVMGDHAVAVVQEEHHLGVPVVGRQGPSVAEDDRLARAPVLEEDLGSVSGRELGHSLPRFPAHFPLWR